MKTCFWRNQSIINQSVQGQCKSWLLLSVDRVNFEYNSVKEKSWSWYWQELSAWLWVAASILCGRCWTSQAVASVWRWGSALLQVTGQEATALEPPAPIPPRWIRNFFLLRCVGFFFLRRYLPQCGRCALKSARASDVTKVTGLPWETIVESKWTSRAKEYWGNSRE